jgi:hypothetical protein
MAVYEIDLSTDGPQVQAALLEMIKQRACRPSVVRQRACCIAALIVTLHPSR